MERENKLAITTVLPLIEITSLHLSGDAEVLPNGFVIMPRNKLQQILDEFDDERAREEFGIDLSEALNADFYLKVAKEYPFPPAESKTLSVVWEEGTQINAERIDRFLLALNLIERLWTFRPDVRLSWYEQDYPVKQKLVSYRHHYPVSTFDGRPALADLQEAAKLISKIDTIYSTNDRDSSYPGIRIAFDALRSGTYGIHTSIRYLQEAIAIETLCSTDTQEVTHRVRVACSLLLGSDLGERKDWYDKAGKIYRKRSALIHGNSNKVTIDELKKIEQVSRKLIRRVLEDRILPNYANRDTQKNFLLELQLGKMTPA